MSENKAYNVVFIRMRLGEGERYSTVRERERERERECAVISVSLGRFPSGIALFWTSHKLHRVADERPPVFPIYIYKTTLDGLIHIYISIHIYMFVCMLLCTHILYVIIWYSSNSSNSTNTFLRIENRNSDLCWYYFHTCLCIINNTRYTQNKSLTHAYDTIQYFGETICFSLDKLWLKLSEFISHSDVY